MSEVHLKIQPDHMPKNVPELVDYLRTMACVDYETGLRRMPNYVDDEVFDAAANEIERLRKALETIRAIGQGASAAGKPEMGIQTIFDHINITLDPVVVEEAST